MCKSEAALKEQELHFNSLTIHGGQEPDESTGAVMTPIYQSSTFIQEAPGSHKGYAYSRSKNPTRSALEKSIASLEAANHGIAFGSGLAAIDAVLKLLKPGDEVIASTDLYGGTYRLFTSIFSKYDIAFHFVDMSNLREVQNAMNPRIKLIWIESPTNPMMALVDIKALCDMAQKPGVLVAVDNTFATPCLQQPLKLGADIVVHSATKYLGGHSDLVLGLIALNDKELAEDLYAIQNASGAICGPMDAFLTLRGIKTLHLRMQRHCENAREIVAFLQEHSKIEKVYWPGLAAHPNYEIARKQMSDFGGMLSFRLKENSREAAFKFLSSLKLISLAESLGGVESLAGHPATMTHASIPLEERLKVGISDGLIRLSIGIEDHRDLITDLKQALAE